MAMDVKEKGANGMVEPLGGLEVISIEDFLFGKLPKALDEVEVWGVWGQEE